MDADLEQLLDLLDSVDENTVGTSVRVPVALRDAAAVAVRAGLIASTSEATVRGLLIQLESVAQRAVLDAHYRDHPGIRPDLGEIAMAAAEISGHPLTARPDLVRRAATELVRIVDDPSPDEVLAYAAGLAAADPAA